MAALNFTNAPAVNDTYQGAGITWTWDGDKWTATGGTINLGDIGDVVISSAAAEDVLVYDGTIWQNEPDVDGLTF